MSTMKTTAGLLAAIGLALAGGAVGPTDTASADAQADYIYDLNHAGIGGPNTELLGLGFSACQEKHQNKSKDASVTNITKSTSLGSQDASFLYDSAMKFLCP